MLGLGCTGLTDVYESPPPPKKKRWLDNNIHCLCSYLMVLYRRSAASTDSFYRNGFNSNTLSTGLIWSVTLCVCVCVSLCMCQLTHCVFCVHVFVQFLLKGCCMLECVLHYSRLHWLPLISWIIIFKPGFCLFVFPFFCVCAMSGSLKCSFLWFSRQYLKWRTS